MKAFIVLTTILAVFFWLGTTRTEAHKREDTIGGKDIAAWHRLAVVRRVERDKARTLLGATVRAYRRVAALTERQRHLLASAPGFTSPLERAFLCIYSHENGGYGWTANTGNGYHGGLQMDREFYTTYGADFTRMFGAAENWPASVQIAVAIRAWATRGYAPWPNTSRMCGLR